MATQLELAAQITDMNTKVLKIQAEQQKRFQDLQDTISNQGQVDPAVTAALDALGSTLTSFDEVVPDVV